ncbi:MAG TPA: acetyltransferase [Sulfurihydrogenibium sp.]|uniref:acyltransferase family protein n=1 Tax=Sulfurihydrogenibium sp. (strain YO3AOP1) TaxID=436114 RepID=UPI0001726831|nr:acyltransferase family protein [Sulfurihydrogenibium sp. YO3AOP1]ACD66863.1 acyltransferase 3 [Sulfurihydrogenibium sp. YO3AOP1]HBT98618.1 acetyltransferase [Sulfurihydrogenibium sp.]
MNKLTKIDGLDGFRGILVLSVIVFHAFLVFSPENLSKFNGGFLAVESFFVLSGFLITKSLIIKNKKLNNFFEVYLDFLKSRLLRLFPAFILLSIIEISFIHLFFPEKLKNLLNELLFGSLNVYNWWLIKREVPYFERFQETLFNLHFWSLSIEWQYYLIWSVIFLILLRFSKIVAIIFTIMLALLSVLDMYIFYKMYENIDRIYFETDTRFSSFMIGSLLALAENKIEKRNWIFLTTGIISLFLLLASFFLLNNYESYMYPFGFLVVSIISALFILSVLKSEYFDKLLSFYPLSYVGVRSYSLYLWHFPIFSFLSLFYAKNIQEAVILGFILSFLISNISYLLIEEPFRRLNFLSLYDLKVVLNLSISSVLLGLVFGYLSFSTDANLAKERNVEKAAFLSISNDKVVSEEVKVSGIDKKSQKDNTKENEENPLEEIKNIEVGNLNGEVILIGDSVLLGASKYVQDFLKNAYIDAKVGRQFKEIYSLLESGKLDKYNKIVIALGNNGYVSKKDLENVIERLKDKEIYLITLKVPRPWQNQVNNTFKEIASEYKNVKIIDWYSYSREKEELFTTDKVHLNNKGAKYFASLIAKNLGIEYKNYKPQQKTDDEQKYDKVEAKINKKESLDNKESDISEKLSNKDKETKGKNVENIILKEQNNPNDEIENLILSAPGE